MVNRTSGSKERLFFNKYKRFGVGKDCCTDAACVSPSVHQDGMFSLMSDQFKLSVLRSVNLWPLTVLS